MLRGPHLHISARCKLAASLLQAWCWGGVLEWPVLPSPCEPALNRRPFLSRGGCAAAAFALLSALALSGATAFAADGLPADLRLADAERFLLAHNRDLKSARAALDAAQGVLASASRRPNPTLTLGAGNAQQGEYRPSDLDRSIRLDQLIERGDKRRLRTRAADEAARAARFDLDEAHRQLRLALAQAYYGLKSAQEAAGFAAADAEALARMLEAARLRLKAGDVARADVSRIEVDAGQADNVLRQARADRETAQLALAALLAREADAPRLEAVDPWPALGGAEVPADRVEAAVAGRPDVLAAAARLESAEARFAGARAQRVRDVSVGVFADQNRLSNGGLTVGVSVSVPLFINNDFSGEIRQAEAERESARIDLDKARAAALADLRRAQAMVRAAADRVERIEARILPSAESATQATEFAYARGAIGLTDLLDARRHLQAARRDLADARAAHAVARAALEASLVPARTTTGPAPPAGAAASAHAVPAILPAAEAPGR